MVVQCPYNEGVICGPIINCIKCGWNPKVAEERRKKLRNEEDQEERKDTP